MPSSSACRRPIFTSQPRDDSGVREASSRQGSLHVNSQTAGADVHVPFGGIKGSGLRPTRAGSRGARVLHRSHNGVSGRVTERFLITGALGCIGAWASAQLVRENVPVVVYDLGENTGRLELVLSPEELDRLTLIRGDVTDLDQLEQTIIDHGITHVVHLAAMLLPLVKADPPRGAAVNVVGTTNVFEAAKRHGVRGIAYASSAAVYGPGAGPRVEDAGEPTSLYGVFKLANEGTAKVFFEDDGVGSVGLRPYVVYGPGSGPGPHRRPDAGNGGCRSRRGLHDALGRSLPAPVRSRRGRDLHRRGTRRASGGCRIQPRRTVVRHMRATSSRQSRPPRQRWWAGSRSRTFNSPSRRKWKREAWSTSSVRSRGHRSTRARAGRSSITARGSLPRLRRGRDWSGRRARRSRPRPRRRPSATPAGSRKTPTPAGVPVAIRSPGSRVIVRAPRTPMILGDREDHVHGCRVSCIVSPFKEDSDSSACGFSHSQPPGTSCGPTGQKGCSRPLPPRVHCPS